MTSQSISRGLCKALPKWWTKILWLSLTKTITLTSRQRTLTPMQSRIAWKKWPSREPKVRLWNEMKPLLRVTNRTSLEFSAMETCQFRLYSSRTMHPSFRFCRAQWLLSIYIRVCHRSDWSHRTRTCTQLRLTIQTRVTYCSTECRPWRHPPFRAWKIRERHPKTDKRGQATSSPSKPHKLTILTSSNRIRRREQGPVCLKPTLRTQFRICTGQTTILTIPKSSCKEVKSKRTRCYMHSTSNSNGWDQQQRKLHPRRKLPISIS